MQPVKGRSTEDETAKIKKWCLAWGVRDKGVKKRACCTSI